MSTDRHSESHPSSERPDDDGTRRVLLDAALEVFLEKGYSGARVQEIARRAGLTTGAIYANFENKSELLTAAIGERGLLALAAVAELVDEDARPLEAMRSFLNLFFRHDQDESERLILDLLSAAGHDDQVADAVREQVTSLDDTIRSFISRAAEDGIVAADVDIETAVYGIRSLGIGMIVSRALDLEQPEASRMAMLLLRLVLLPGPIETPIKL
ncbi:MAG: hypothetical protein JJLCMIEE_00524 [Acidimicrobiales bacterium]|nr:MAG: TetR/AcrR family transcriptional regulator [Actinomycetota bacterium]MBV6507476.1 hypothetical protein [Acidimicrobiales bacterium]RIK07854.1 MAG: hypothetical protein DCC48_02570 [Acidobacteriota bacterium]